MDAFNFHFTMSLSEQVGFGRPVDGGLTLQLSRVYNSSIYSDKSWQCKLSNCTDNGETSETHTYLSIPRRNAMASGGSFTWAKS
ncbi:MAG: hypothetical protein Q9Q40_15075 [Acidobacteriota bacterium]|nr:hypothetical protein [Acidobacteriota bacterium]